LRFGAVVHGRKFSLRLFRSFFAGVNGHCLASTPVGKQFRNGGDVLQVTAEDTGDDGVTGFMVGDVTT